MASEPVRSTITEDAPAALMVMDDAELKLLMLRENTRSLPDPVSVMPP